MKNKALVLGAVAMVVFVSSCASLKPFTNDDFRQLGVVVPTEQTKTGK